MTEAAGVPNHSPSPGAKRMRELRRRRRRGLKYVPIPIYDSDVDVLIARGHLKEKERGDADTLQAAILNIVYHALED
jgi:hypothetical protein